MHRFTVSLWNNIPFNNAPSRENCASFKRVSGFAFFSLPLSVSLFTPGIEIRSELRLVGSGRTQTVSCEGIWN